MIVVVDYGMGNLRSVSKALEHLNAKVKVSSELREIQAADKLVLPGVGAFGDAIKELHASGLFHPVKEHVLKQKPLLGICLGLQLLCRESEESRGVEGLGIFPGKVRKFQSRGVKVPHMGWNQVTVSQRHPLLKGIDDGAYFYFVHSYYAGTENPEVVASVCEYGQETFAAMLGSDTVFATQFHPEKSQQAGLTILKNFISW